MVSLWVGDFSFVFFCVVFLFFWDRDVGIYICLDKGRGCRICLGRGWDFEILI